METKNTLSKIGITLVYAAIAASALASVINIKNHMSANNEQPSVQVAEEQIINDIYSQCKYTKISIEQLRQGFELRQLQDIHMTLQIIDQYKQTPATSNPQELVDMKNELCAAVEAYTQGMEI